MTERSDSELREVALQFANQAGESPDSVVRRAQTYLNFLKGGDPVPEPERARGPYHANRPIA